MCKRDREKERDRERERDRQNEIDSKKQEEMRKMQGEGIRKGGLNELFSSVMVKISILFFFSVQKVPS